MFCSICTHGERERIEQALIKGKPLRDIAGQHSVSRSALHRHKKHHLPPKLAKAEQAQEVAQADDLLEELGKLRRITWAILGKALAANDLKTTLQAVAQAKSNLELMARLEERLRDGVTINILAVPEWITLRTVILRSLEPYPEARLALAEALQEVEKSAGS
jgi:hypothetical protein